MALPAEDRELGENPRAADVRERGGGYQPQFGDGSPRQLGLAGQPRKKQGKISCKIVRILQSLG